ncbi:MAG: 7-cyano-7-deazaguanine synthase [Candidatus Hermodarchaeota archaeon]
MPKVAIICISGGVESTTVAHIVVNKHSFTKVFGITANYGHRARIEEGVCIDHLSQKLHFSITEVPILWLKEISGSFLTDPDRSIPYVSDDELDSSSSAIERMKWWWVPSRNALIATIASAFAEHEILNNPGTNVEIFLGIRREEPVPMPDNTPEFVATLNNLLKTSTLPTFFGEGSIRVSAPLITQTKAEIIKIGTELGVEWEYTYSCYAGNKGILQNNLPIHCGLCSNCLRRKRAFNDAGIADPSIYRA